MDNIIDKFQGNINKLIEEDESVAASEQDKHGDENDVNYLQLRLAILERKNEVLMGKSPNLAQLPLMLNLMNVLKNKSFIDRKICLNETCAGQHHLFVPNYWSENKMVLHKSDSS